jgi:hypothetical protein
MTLRGKVVPSMVVAVVLLATGPARAGDLADLIPNLFGTGGITLAPPTTGFSHVPHFTVASTQQLTTLNEALTSQLANIPLPSPASGFTFKLDPTLGTFVRSTEGFGPIYADRAETIGKGHFSIGFGYSRFDFDSLDGRDLHNGQVQLKFGHGPTGQALGLPPFAFEEDFLTASINADITYDFFLFTGTYGVLDNLDLSFLLPIIHLDMDVTGTAQIHHVGTAPGTVHRFTNGGDTETFHRSDDATGIGDLVLRGKYNFYRREKTVSLAAILDLRLPTGNDDDLLGLGTPRVLPFLVASGGPWYGVSPHVNVGFDLGDSSTVDNAFVYRLGFDWTPVNWFTFAFDVLGRYIIDNSRVEPDGTPAGSNLIDASIGFKANVWKNLLLLANVLLPMNSTGLRADFVPFVGIEWTY